MKIHVTLTELSMPTKAINVKVEHYENTRSVNATVWDWPNGTKRVFAFSVPDLSKPSRVEHVTLSIPSFR